MRFDEAFDILAEKCAEADRRLNSAPPDNQTALSNLRSSTYGCDIWIARIVGDEIASPSLQDYLPFYEAAWEMCRMGVLRPGPWVPRGQHLGSGAFWTDGYSITSVGRRWLNDPERRNFGDPGRMAKLLESFEPKFGEGFRQRSTEAVRCHRASNYLACCVMAGAAAESILLSVAIQKAGNEEDVLKAYSRSNGRKAVIDQITHGLSAGLRWQFDAGRQLLHYWRDDAAHGKQTAISETVAYVSLAQLLRFAHFCSDEWAELTSQ